MARTWLAHYRNVATNNEGKGKKKDFNGDRGRTLEKLRFADIHTRARCAHSHVWLSVSQ